MNVVLAFPNKVFVEWGAVAQELGSYLTLLGATKPQAREIIGRLQRRWETLGAPLGLQGLRSIPKPPADEQGAAAKAAGNGHDAGPVSYWKSQHLRTLLELARREYQQLPVH